MNGVVDTSDHECDHAAAYYHEHLDVWRCPDCYRSFPTDPTKEGG